MIEKVNITDAGVIEQIRSTMPVVTQSAKGLMPQNLPINIDKYSVDISLNELRKSGYYHFDDKIVREGAPNGIGNYDMVVFSTSYYSTLQIIYTSSRRIMFRVIWGEIKGEWLEI